MERQVPTTIDERNLKGVANDYDSGSVTESKEGISCGDASTVDVDKDANVIIRDHTKLHRSSSGGGSKTDTDTDDDGDDEFNVVLMKECISSLDLSQEQQSGSIASGVIVGGSGNVDSNILSGLPSPTFLHPATAAGMKHVSSCYFSIASRVSDDENGDDDDVLWYGDNQLDGAMMIEDDDATAAEKLRECRESAADLLQLLDFDEKDKRRKKTRKELSPDQLRSSVYFDTLPHSGEHEEEKTQGEEHDKSDASSADSVAAKWNAVDVLYHDIMMHVLTFLPAKCLASFSETARRPNFEVFYFLQLQLQRALLYLPPVSSSDQSRTDTAAKGLSIDSGVGKNVLYHDAISPIAGSGLISRLAATDMAAAQSIVQEYLDSNTTLHVMPLSHSLAYLRHVLLRSGPDFSQYPHGPGENATKTAAMFITLVGAASVMSGAADNVMGGMDPTMLRDAILGAGLAGSIMKAVGERTKAEGSGDRGAAVGGKAAKMKQLMENMSRLLHGRSHHYHAAHGEGEEESSSSTLSRFPSSLASMLHGAFSSAQSTTTTTTVSGLSENCGDNVAAADDGTTDSTTNSTTSTTQNVCGHHREKRSKVQRDTNESSSQHLSDEQNPSLITPAQSSESLSPFNNHDMLYAMEHPVTSNPYDHLSVIDDIAMEESKSNYGDVQNGVNVALPKSKSTHKENERLPSGCVGAYTRAVHRATTMLTNTIKDKQKAAFMTLPMDEQNFVSTAFIEACGSDDNLAIVKDFVKKQGLIDVDGYYVGDDGTETCALHSAAFNGSNQILEFLCNGLDEHDANNDGALCDVNVRDDNGWTALHFAAGANNVKGVQILAAHGANLTIEASNGYTPFHWAQRLSNKEVAEELKKLGADNRFLETRWMTRKPFTSFFSNRFFAFYPAV